MRVTPPTRPPRCASSRPRSRTVGTSAGGVGILSLRFNADVTAAIELALAQEAATAGVIAMVIAGPIGVAAAVLILGCRLIMERRRSSLRLLSARGSSTGQLRGMLGLEGVFVGLVPASVGRRPSSTRQRCCSARRRRRRVRPGTAHGSGSARHPRGPRAAGRRAPDACRPGAPGITPRLIVEGVVVALAGVAVALLFLRGYGAGVDPLQAATPLLLSLVACLVTLRVYPVPLAAVVSRRARGRPASPRSSGRREPCASPRSG